MLCASRARTSAGGLLYATAATRAGGGGVSPGWSIPEAHYHKYTYQPTIPDKHYHIGHYNYAPITLWLRDRRPTMERILSAMAASATQYYQMTLGTLFTAWDKALPGFGLKCLGFLGVLLGYNIFVAFILDRTEAYMVLEKLKTHSKAQQMWASGFFASESEDTEARMQKYNLKAMELEQLWSDTLADATEARDFSKFVNQLQPEVCHPDEKLDAPISWRFNMMPYGRDSPDTKTFPDNGIDSPSSSLHFFGDIGSPGDYIERVDNKKGNLKKARHMYTGAYIPPTK